MQTYSKCGLGISAEMKH